MSDSHPIWWEWYPAVERPIRSALDVALKLAFMNDEAEVNDRVQSLANEVALLDDVKREAAELDPGPVEVGRPNLHLIPGGDAS